MLHFIDQEFFDSLVIVPDDDDAPQWRFGRYIHATKRRAVIRQDVEERARMMRAYRSLGKTLHERESDIAPFVFWDGEGITYDDGMPQQYVLFGSSLGHEISAERLRTLDCLNLIIDAEEDLPYAIHVSFAFKYDAEMILCDLPLAHWYMLRKAGSVQWQGFLITYHPGRLLRVTQTRDGKRYTATIYDTWGFFQGSFIAALRNWLNDSELAEVDRIETGKKARGAFTYDQLESFIRPYWQAELRLGVLLMDRLRERLTAAGVCPSQWYGAGAIATTLYRRHGMRQHLSRTPTYRHDKDKDILTVLPDEVADASRYAYAGGRFELLRLGHTDEKVYQYDIRSAYPSAIATLPTLTNAEWTHHVSPRFNHRLFALWRIEYDDWTPYTALQASPLFCRDNAGRMSYPQAVSGWYWTPEAALVASNPKARIAEAWICHHQDEYPFAWVQELYDERRVRKAAGDPSEKGLKLALNSLY